MSDTKRDTKLRPYNQAYCNNCNEPIGFSGQPTAYSSEEGGWDCPRHINPNRRRRIDGV